MAELRALIWDVDGTLADTEALHLACFNAAIAAVGLDFAWSVDGYKEALRIAGGKERLRAALSALDVAEDDLGDLVNRIHLDKTARYVAAVQAGELALRPGVQRLVREAQRAGLRQAIATTTTRANVDALLASTFGADHPFEVIACADSAPRKKPAPDVYLATLGALGLAADDTLAIEDSANGVRAAAAAGVPVLVTRSEFGGSGFDGAAAVLTHLGEPGNPARAEASPIAFEGAADTAWAGELHRLAVRGAAGARP
jgi:HAD superfamily hydrolase (TIGR01509 family)